MEPINENPEKNKRPQDTPVDPAQPQRKYPHQSDNTELDDDSDNESSAPHTDELRKGTFTDRPHGRTNPPLGPDHEPGTL